MIEIPVFQKVSADFTQVIVLDGIRTELRLVFNVRNEKWNLTITANGQNIYSLPVIFNFPLIYNHRGLFDVLSGDFIVYNKQTGSSAITYDSLGDSVGLYYISAEEVTVWEAANGLD